MLFPSKGIKLYFVFIAPVTDLLEIDPFFFRLKSSERNFVPSFSFDAIYSFAQCYSAGYCKAIQCFFFPMMAGVTTGRPERD